MTSSSDTRVVSGRYQLHRELGRGGMGIVWQAWDPELERDVAIKEVLVPEELSDEEREEMHSRTRREARSAARLTHPSIITIHDVFDFDGHPWIVMELVTGRALDRILKEDGPLPPERLSTVASALVGALSLAHSKGVIHRDIKPGNVMISQDDRVLLTDFGIATIDGETAITRTGSLIGSPEYMAPERLEQENSEAPSDMWSLGATLYAACEGQSPFKRETVTAAISAVLSAPVPQPQRAGALTPVLMGMLERDTNRRLGAARASQMLAAGTPTVGQAPPTGPTAAMGTPPGGSAPPGQPPGPYPGPYGPPPTGPTAAQPPQYAPPSGPQVPPTHQNGGAPPPNSGPQPSGGGSSRPTGRGGKRTLLVTAAAAAALLLLAGAGVVWFTTRPLDAEYQLLVSDEFSVEYPTDWRTEQNEDSDSSWRVSHNDSKEETYFYVSWYTPEDDTTDPERLLENETEPSAKKDYSQYTRERLETVDDQYYPDAWNVAEWSYEYVDKDEFDEHPERFVTRMQINPGGDEEEQYWIRWNLPREKRSDYQNIIEHTQHSLRPYVDGTM
ncbi:serine/threonine-protein kinase [Haloactinospora alba]|nr:serine/threonine-protein kinase [Haloactinospora alba]